MTTPESVAPVVEETVEESTVEESTVLDPAADENPEGAEQLGEAGKRALDAMKEKWKSERDKRRELELKLNPPPTPPAEGDQPDTEALVRQAEQAATAKANARIVRSEIRAAAAGKLADPKDALTFIDPAQFDVDDDGQVDEAEIADAIDDLLKSKPYLAAQGGKRFQGTADSGARKGSGRPAQLTREALHGMSAEDIVKAKADGRLDDELGIKR